MTRSGFNLDTNFRQATKGSGMKQLRMMVLMATVLMAFSVSARDKVVYGEDDRLDLFEVQDNLHLTLASSTAAMIRGGSLQTNGDVTTITGSTLQQRGICAGEKFADQLTAANCSGFLVGPDLLVTAGHCIRSQSDCQTYKWVFDFAVDSEGKASFEVPSSNVYGCKEIIEQSLSRSTMDDYALIRLERNVTDREPLRVRTEGKVENGTPLVVIGHPTGLPTKVAAGAWVRSNGNGVYFQSNLDTFGGNSGSAVFDSETGLVEGILVRGETDYTFDSRRGCRVPKYCSNSGCRGEDVTRITNIKALRDLL